MSKVKPREVKVVECIVSDRCLCWDRVFAAEFVLEKWIDEDVLFHGQWDSW